MSAQNNKKQAVEVLYLLKTAKILSAKRHKKMTQWKKIKEVLQVKAMLKKSNHKDLFKKKKKAVLKKSNHRDLCMKKKAVMKKWNLKNPCMKKKWNLKNPCMKIKAMLHLQSPA